MFLAAFLFASIFIFVLLGIISLIVLLISRIFNIKQKRPYVITSICILMIFVIFSYVRSVFVKPEFSLVGILLGFLIYPAFIVIGVLGLWFMRKWSLYVLFGGIFILMLVQFVSGLWNSGAFIYFIPVLPSLFYYKKFK